MQTVTFHVDLTRCLLAVALPFMALLAVVSVMGLLRGPDRGLLRVVFPWRWLLLVAPMLVAGTWGVVRALLGW